MKKEINLTQKTNANDMIQQKKLKKKTKKNKRTKIT